MSERTKKSALLTASFTLSLLAVTVNTPELILVLVVQSKVIIIPPGSTWRSTLATHVAVILHGEGATSCLASPAPDGTNALEEALGDSQ